MKKVVDLALLLFLLTGFTYPENAASEPQGSILRLLDGLQKAAMTGAPMDQFFSPSARGREKKNIAALQREGFTKFQFVDYSLKDLQLQDADHATLPVTVEYSTRDEEGSRTTTLQFVREQGVWYFAKADFWEVSFLWFLPMIGYGACYGCGVFIMYWHSNRQNWANPKKKTLWQILLFVPFSLFFYFVRKPWATA
jgi:hypothetical protein